jgi:hypothetical protein
MCLEYWLAFIYISFALKLDWTSWVSSVCHLLRSYTWEIGYMCHIPEIQLLVGRPAKFHTATFFFWHRNPVAKCFTCHQLSCCGSEGNSNSFVSCSSYLDGNLEYQIVYSVCKNMELGTLLYYKNFNRCFLSIFLFISCSVSFFLTYMSASYC